MFDSRAEAQHALERLIAAGIPLSRIRMVSGETTGSSMTTTGGADDNKGFWDSLGDFFFPDEDRYTYAEGLSRGGYLVTGSEYGPALGHSGRRGQRRPGPARAKLAFGRLGRPWVQLLCLGRHRIQLCIHGRLHSLGLWHPGRRDRQRLCHSLRDEDSLHDKETILGIAERIRVGKRETGHCRIRVPTHKVEQPVSESVDPREERVETRLAFARLFARTGTQVPVILDDALVHSDDDRIEAMFTALHRVARDQQILVLTCRQRAFAALGGERARVVVEAV